MSIDAVPAIPESSTRKWIGKAGGKVATLVPDTQKPDFWDS